MNKAIKAVFIGGPADGRKMEIHRDMQRVQIPQLTTPVNYVDSVSEPQRDTFRSFDYVVHLVDVPGATVAICTLDEKFSWGDAMLALLDGYREDNTPEGEQRELERKDAQRFRYLASKARVEDRDGGYFGLYTFPHIVQRDYHRSVNFVNVRAAIDAAMGGLS